MLNDLFAEILRPTHLFIYFHKLMFSILFYMILMDCPFEFHSRVCRFSKWHVSLSVLPRRRCQIKLSLSVILWPHRV